jgi:rhodanese-related sulfurtransferase
MKKPILIIMSIFSSIFGAQAQQNDAYKILEAQTFKDSIAIKNIQLIDVRTPDEYKSGHIKNAKNIDFYSGNFNAEFNKLDKEKPVYIYCRSGSRSRQSANKLAAMGFKRIYDLEGGILNYN